MTLFLFTLVQVGRQNGQNVKKFHLQTTRTVKGFSGFDDAFLPTNQDPFSKRIKAACRAIRVRFNQAGVRITSLLSDILGQKRETDLSSASKLDPVLAQFGFAGARSASVQVVPDSQVRSPRSSTPVFSPPKRQGASGKKKQGQGLRPQCGKADGKADVQQLGFDYDTAFDASQMPQMDIGMRACSRTILVPASQRARTSH